VSCSDWYVWHLADSYSKLLTHSAAMVPRRMGIKIAYRTSFAIPALQHALVLPAFSKKL